MIFHIFIQQFIYVITVLYAQFAIRMRTKNKNVSFWIIKNIHYIILIYISMHSTEMDFNLIIIEYFCTPRAHALRTQNKHSAFVFWRWTNIFIKMYILNVSNLAWLHAYKRRRPRHHLESLAFDSVLLVLFLGNGCSHHFYLMINFNSCYYDGSYDKCKEEIWNTFHEKLQILLYIISLCIDAQSLTIIHCSIVVHSHSIVVAVHEWWADSDFFAFFFAPPRSIAK